MVERFLTGADAAGTVTRGRSANERRGIPMHPKPVKKGGPQPKPVKR